MIPLERACARGGRLQCFSHNVFGQRRYGMQIRLFSAAASRFAKQGGECRDCAAGDWGGPGDGPTLHWLDRVEPGRSEKPVLLGDSEG